MTWQYLQKSPGIRWYNFQELLLWINNCTLTSSVELGLLSEANGPKKGEKQLVSPSRQCSSSPVGFGQGILSKQQCDNTGASIIISWPGFSWFSPALNWNQHWSVGAVVILLTSLRMRRKSWNGFHKMVSRNVSNVFAVAGRSAQLQKRNILKKI